MRATSNGRRSAFSNFDRLTSLSLVFFLLIALIIGCLFKLQILDHQKYVTLAQEQHFALSSLAPTRGQIFIHDYQAGQDVQYPVALNRKYYLVYGVPNQVTNPQKYAKILAPMLEMDEATVLKRLSKDNDIYEPLKHRLTEEQKKQLEDLGLAGIRFEEEVWRTYPDKNIGSQVLGFVGYDQDKLKGRYGVEGYWDKELAGAQGSFVFERDASGRLIPIASRTKQAAQNGADITLTLDRSIQYTACSSLSATVLKYGADNGTVIVMDPVSGAILAMCNYPDFDPNDYAKVSDISVYNNLAIFEPYEPGSMIKGLTMAAALDTGKVTPATTYEDTGTVTIDGYTIHNSDGKAHGIKTMTEVLEESLNTGAIWAAKQVGQQLFKEYFKNFGFGELSNIMLETERSGSLKNLDSSKEISMYTASFGQGITATPLQIIKAFSAIANKGKMMAPYIIDEVHYANGQVKKTQPQFVRQVISQQTAVTLSAMLGSVVKYGHAKRAAVAGYYIAGKTGTAQVADQATGKYSTDKTIHSFVGFAPIDDPKFVILIKLSNPKGVAWAESTAVPLFSEIAQFLLNYLKVPPTQ